MKTFRGHYFLLCLDNMPLTHGMFNSFLHILLTLIISLPFLTAWDEWTPWNPCNKTCGEGHSRLRERSCLNLNDSSVEEEPELCNRLLGGESFETKECVLPGCAGIVLRPKTKAIQQLRQSNFETI